MLCFLGLYTETMVHCLRALRESSGILLATMEIFIRDPITDWERLAKLQSSNIGNFYYHFSDLNAIVRVDSLFHHVKPLYTLEPGIPVGSFYVVKCQS